MNEIGFLTELTFTFVIFLQQSQIDEIFREMKAMPPPLTAIVTPRVDLSSHMGNIGRLGVPKYFSQAMLPPLMKPIESPPHTMKVNIVKNEQ